MAKATIELDNTTSAAPVYSGKLITVRPSQVQLDPVTDVRTGSIAKDEAERIDNLAKTMYEQGQLQPIVVRQNGSKDSYLIVAGRRRHAAALVIEQKTGQPYDLNAMLVEKSDDEAYAAAIQENLARRQFSPIELANNIQEIRKRLSLTGADWTKHVAEFLHVSRATISQHAKLLELPKAIQNKVHSGVLSAQSAFDLAAVETSQQEAVLEKASKLADAEAAEKPAKSTKAAKASASGKGEAAAEPQVESGKIKRKHILAAARESEAITTTKPRTRNEIMAFFTQILDSADSYSEPIYNFCQTFVNKWATGQVSDRSLLNRLNDLNEICEDSTGSKPAKTKKAK